MASLDHLQQAGTDALTGVLTGATNSEEAFQQLGQAILREAVGALVQMGIQQVKNMVMGQAAQTAAAATSVATAAATTAAWTPAAIATSIASFGAAAIAGMAALPALLTSSGGRQYGGPVGAGKMYRVNENGAPEVFNAANGRQYMMPNTRGEVVSNKDAAGGGGGIQIDVQVSNSGAPKQATAQVSQVGDRQFVLSVMMEDLRSGSPASYAQQHANTFGLRRAPR